MLKIAEIQFNHDQNAGRSGILNLRVGPEPQTRIRAPEYRPGSVQPVAYAKDAIAGAVTIKIRLNGPANSRFRIETTDDPLLGGVRGTVEIGSLGQSELVQLTLERHRLNDAPAGRHTPKWIWKVQANGALQPFDETCFVVYTVLDLPNPPWTNQPAEEPDLQLPWVGALDLALKWASGTTVKDSAAENITIGMRLSGLFKFTRCCPLFLKGSDFWLSSLIEEVPRAATMRVNCTDCANTVAVLSSVLGCNLQNMEMGLFQTRCVLPIGFSEWTTFPFTHVVARLEENGGTFVYDSCLGLALDSRPCPTSREPSLAAKMPLPKYQRLLTESPMIQTVRLEPRRVV